MKGKQSSNQNTQKLIAAFYQKNYSLIEIYIYIYIIKCKNKKAKLPMVFFFMYIDSKGILKVSNLLIYIRENEINK